MDILKISMAISALLITCWVGALLLAWAWEMLAYWIDDGETPIQPNAVFAYSKRITGMQGEDTAEFFVGFILGLMLWPALLMALLFISMAKRARDRRRQQKLSSGAGSAAMSSCQVVEIAQQRIEAVEPAQTYLEKLEPGDKLTVAM